MQGSEKKKEYMSLGWSIVVVILAAVSATMYCFFDGAPKTIFLVLICVFAALAVVLLICAINFHFNHTKELEEETKDLK